VIVGIPRETRPTERRVSMTPQTIPRLSGMSVIVERGAGQEAGFPDSAYEKAGASMVDDAGSLYEKTDVILKVQPPLPAEAQLFRQGSILASLLHPKSNLDVVKELDLRGSYTELDGSLVEYNATRPKAGLLGMLAAGMISGLLGIGSGTFKVISMDVAMKLPMKVSTTTSNFMIGVTAAASAGIYFVRGDVNPFIAAPVAVGVLIGASVGTRLLMRARNPTVRKVFAVVLAASAVEMIARALGV